MEPLPPKLENVSQTTADSGYQEVEKEFPSVSSDSEVQFGAPAEVVGTGDRSNGSHQPSSSQQDTVAFVPSVSASRTANSKLICQSKTITSTGDSQEVESDPEDQADKNTEAAVTVGKHTGTTDKPEANVNALALETGDAPGTSHLLRPAQCTSPSTTAGEVGTGDVDVPERLQEEDDTGSPQHRHQTECQDSPRSVTLEGEDIEELENQIENLDITEPEFPETGHDNSLSNFSSEAEQDNFLGAVELESHSSSMVVTQTSDNPEVNQPRKGMYIILYVP